MKKNKVSVILVLLFSIIALGIFVSNVNAAELKISGIEEIEGTEGKLLVKVKNDVDIGVVQGVLSHDDNIEYVRLNTSYNGWTTTYNESIGLFNIFNATGTKDGEVLELEYKLKDNKDKGTIKIDNIELTTIDYEVLELENEESKTITKKAVIEEPSSNSSNGNNNNNEEKENINENEDNKINNEEQKDELLEDEAAKTDKEDKNNSLNENVAPDPIPQTGNNTLMIVAILIVFLAILVFVYKKYRFYNV